MLDYLRNHLNQSYSLDELAQYSKMSCRTFTRQFNKATGMPVGERLTAERLQRSQELLESTSLPIDAIAAQAGFQSATSLRQRFDVTLGEWRKTFQGKQPPAVETPVADDVSSSNVAPCNRTGGT